MKLGIQVPTGKGRPYRLNVPYRWVLHTIECPPNLGRTRLESLARAHQYPPHFWVDMPNKVIVQTVDSDLAAQALAHPSGTVETNHARALQVEIAGYAKDVASYPASWWVWLGDALVAPVARHHRVNLGERAKFVAYPQSYGHAASQRFDTGRWLAFNGVCGHQHVPANDHGDPGLVPISLICNSTAPPPGGNVPTDSQMLVDIQKRVQKIESIVDEGGSLAQRTDLALDHLEGRDPSAPGAVPRDMLPIRDLLTRLCNHFGVDTD